jgi:hypothetical protein
LTLLLLLLPLAGCLRIGGFTFEVNPNLGDAHFPGVYSVMDYGAIGDGVSDDTEAFQSALDIASQNGGGVVMVPAATFNLLGALDIPDNVTLEGLWRAPQRGVIPDKGGTVLLAHIGQGDIDGTPFITLNENSVLKGVTIFYPEQIRANPPIPWSWCVRGGGGDNVTILDVTMINPYQAVDLGTKTSGRHYINNLHAYPLYKGLYINQCYDVGRIENIHFWPFWDIDPASPLWVFTKENATSFIIGKTDGEMAMNLFSIFYKVGMHFIDGPIYEADGSIKTHAAGSGMYTNCYIDVTPCAILVDSAMPHAGVSFVNGSIMSKVVVGPANQGPVKFSASGFWGVNGLTSQAELKGRGPIIFEGCHFNGWDKVKVDAPCILADNQSLLVNACHFNQERPGHRVIELNRGVRSAVITSNLFPGGELITNNAAANAHIVIANNAVLPEPAHVREWIILGPFPNPTLEDAPAGEPTRSGYATDYLHSLGGESAANLTPATSVDFDSGGEQGTATAQLIKGWPVVDLHQAWKPTNKVAYAFVYLHSDREQIARFEFCMNDGGKAWLNGQQVYERFAPAGANCMPGMDQFQAQLKPGKNPLLLKIEDGGGTRWRFEFEAYGEDGEALKTSLD